MPRRMYKGLSSWLMILGLVFSMGMSQLNAILAAQQTAGHKEYVAIATTSLQQRAVETDNCLVDNPFPHGLDRRLVSPNLSESINHFPPSTVGPTSWGGARMAAAAYGAVNAYPQHATQSSRPPFQMSTQIPSQSVFVVASDLASH